MIKAGERNTDKVIEDSDRYVLEYEAEKQKKE
jgi:hypothetical protein